MTVIKHFVAFSGGLDSTWVMYKLLEEGKMVVPVHIALGAAVTQSIPEILVKREIINRLKTKFPDQIIDEHLTRNPSHQLNVIDGVDWEVGAVLPGHRLRDTLIQQLCVRNSLANCMMLSGIHQRFYAGWHSTDVPTTFSEDIHKRLCDLNDIYRISDAKYIAYHSGWDEYNPTIELPAWDVPKKQMWDDLPKDLQEMVMVGKCRDLSMYGDSEISFTVVSPKIKEYWECGFKVSEHFVMPFPVEDIDLLFIYSTCVNFDGSWTDEYPELNTFFKYCFDCFEGISQRMRWPSGKSTPWEARFVHHVGLRQNFKSNLRSPKAYPEGRGYVLTHESIKSSEIGE